MEEAKQIKYTVRAGLILAIVWLMVAFFVMSVSAATTGIGNTTNSEFVWSWSTDNTATGAAGTFTGSLTEKTLTLTISANSSIHLDEEKDNCGNVTQKAQNAASTKNTAKITNNTYSTISIEKITTTTATCSVSKGTLLAHGDSFEVYITADPNSLEDNTSSKNSDSVVIEYSVVENVDVVYYGADGASYTYGDVLLNNATATVTAKVPVGSSITLPVAPEISSGTFLGWRLSHDGSLNAAGAAITVVNETSIYPVIKQAGMKAPFTVNGTAYEFWTDAAKAAGNSDTITLNQDYTLPSTMAANGVSPVGSKYVTGADGNVNYIVPSGVTLLIPFDNANTCYTTSPGTMTYDRDAGESFNTYKPYAYRTLTMASGANITVKGALSVSSKHSATQGSNGSPIYALSFINMKDESTITIESGGKLYAWGYITGSGSVVAKNGATVYENFQIADWRGGNCTSDMNNSHNQYRVFPFSQYYVQNIEVPLTLYAGALEYATMSVDVTLAGVQSSILPFVGTKDSMFVISSGYAIKDYIEGSGRTKIEIHGEVSLSPISVTIRASFLGNVTLKSAEYVLPIGAHMTVDIQSGNVTVVQDVAMLPGSEIYLREDANFILGTGNKLYVYDWNDWSGYCYTNNSKYVVLNYVPGGNGTTGREKDALVQVDGFADLSAGSVYTTTNGANIYSTGTGRINLTVGTDKVAYQVTQSGNTVGKWNEIAITSAKLKNGDGSYVETASAASVTAYAYCAEHDAWACGNSDKGVVNFATNVELGNSLNMYFAFWGNDITTSSGHYVVVSHAGGDIPFTSDLWQTTSVQIGGELMAENAYVVYFKGLSAKQMGDVITVTLYDGGGNVVDTWSNSIQHYAMRMLSMHSDNETLRTLIVDMLNYGAACQKEFQYNTDNLVDAGLSAVQQGWATKTVTLNATSNENPNFQANLIVDGNIQFAVSGVNDLSSYSFTNHWNIPRDGQEFKSADGYYYISKLYVADARQVITITVNGTTFTDSIESYCKRMIDKGEDTNEVFTSFMKFSDAARAYLHDKENRV